MVADEPHVRPVVVGVHGLVQQGDGLVQVGDVAEEPAAERPGRGDGAVLFPGDLQVGQLGEGLSGRLRGLVVVDGDDAVFVLGEDPVSDGNSRSKASVSSDCSAGSTISRLAWKPSWSRSPTLSLPQPATVT